MGGRNNERIEGLWGGTQLLDRGGVVCMNLWKSFCCITTNLSNSTISRQLRYLCDILRLVSITDSIDWKVTNQGEEMEACGVFMLFLI